MLNELIEMVEIPSGEFMMGSPDTESQRGSDESPQHRVTVSSFWMGKYPVTQAQWKVVAELVKKVDRDLEADPAAFKGGNLPVEQVTWYDAMEFCARLSLVTKRPYRLPSEAEWEYACRAGTTTPFHFGPKITPDLANYDGNYVYGGSPRGEYRRKTTEVGSFQVANDFGLYDMHGNVWEWCLDHWHDNYEGAPTDGSAWTAGGDSSLRLLRGGSWDFNPRNCRSAFRNWVEPADRNYSIGFRVVCSNKLSVFEELDVFAERFKLKGSDKTKFLLHAYKLYYQQEVTPEFLAEIAIKELKNKQYLLT